MLHGLGFIALGFVASYIPWGTKNEQKIIDRLISSSDLILGATMVVLTVLIALSLVFIGLQGNWIDLGNIGSYIARGLPLLVWFALIIVQLQGWMMLNGIASKCELESLDLFYLQPA